MELSELQQVSDGIVPVLPNIPAIYSGESWETLQSTSDEFFGADLEKGDQLVGVPFAAVRLTFRPGDYLRSDMKEKGDYVSIDVIIGPDDEIKRGIFRGRIKEPVMVMAGEHLVVNEAGTGVYRQLVQYLEGTQRIRLNSDLPQEGRYGDSRYDIPVGHWEVDRSAVRTTGADGRPSVAFDVRLLCPRGFRVSEYENEYTKEGKTRYIG